jgi:hypothetical protein
VPGRARDFPKKPVYSLGTGESDETLDVSQMADLTSSRAFRVAGPKRPLPRPASHAARSTI